MSCPIDKYQGLTDGQIERFCKEGCSVECERFLGEYVVKLKRRGEYKEQKKKRCK